MTSEPLFGGITDQDQQAIIKLIVYKKSDRVSGAHMVAEQSADFIHLALGITKEVTKQELDATISIRPTTGKEFLMLD